jgi:hypothetical protein
MKHSEKAKGNKVGETLESFTNLTASTLLLLLLLHFVH